MVDKLITILEDNTALVENTDLFYLEIPLGKIGVWFSDRQTPSKFNGTGYKEFDMFYRGKTKQSAIKNIEYLTDKINEISAEVCQISDGTTFRLKVLYQWDSIGKDSEGYYVYGTVVSLVA